MTNRDDFRRRRDDFVTILGLPAQSRIRFVYDFRRFHDDFMWHDLVCPQHRIRFVYDFRRFHVARFWGALNIVYDSYTILDDFMLYRLRPVASPPRVRYPPDRGKVVRFPYEIVMKSYDFDTKSFPNRAKSPPNRTKSYDFDTKSS